MISHTKASCSMGGSANHKSWLSELQPQLDGSCHLSGLEGAVLGDLVLLQQSVVGSHDPPEARCHRRRQDCDIGGEFYTV